ncbi:GNAT family N-acetyltransferase [Thalassiella azotivora]
MTTAAPAPGADDALPLVPVDVSDEAAMTAWATAATRVFLKPAPTPESVRQRQERMADHRLWAVHDRGRTVATFRSFDSDLSLPGRDDPWDVNAISSVTVLPTHRRRGLLSRWMTGELDRARDAGHAASILIASEAPIYGRFGFGVATRACRWTLDALRARFTVPVSGSVELVGREEFVDLADDLYDRARWRSPGTIRRPRLRWQGIAQTVPAGGEEDRLRQLAVHRSADGTVDGVLVYSVKDEDTDRVPSARLTVTDLWAADDAAYADLWRFCADVDFVSTVVADDRSPAEPLPLLLADPRAARDGAVSDFLWLRLHDVPAALSARRYPVAGTLVLDVADPLGQVDGRYRLEVDDSGTGRCERVGDARTTQTTSADVTVGAGTLASLLLGDGDVGALARVGRLLSADSQALGRAGALLGWPDDAWCGTWF